MLWGRKDKTRIDSMSTKDRHEAIKRLERERKKVNSEIENILKSYAKESGNRSLKAKRRLLGAPNDWEFMGQD